MEGISTPLPHSSLISLSAISHSLSPIMQPGVVSCTGVHANRVMYPRTHDNTVSSEVNVCHAVKCSLIVPALNLLCTFNTLPLPARASTHGIPSGSTFCKQTKSCGLSPPSYVFPPLGLLSVCKQTGSWGIPPACGQSPLQDLLTSCVSVHLVLRGFLLTISASGLDVPGLTPLCNPGLTLKKMERHGWRCSPPYL